MTESFFVFITAAFITGLTLGALLGFMVARLGR